MENVVYHILAALIIWASAVTGFLCTYLFSGNARILSLGNAFGGGVLLAAGLVHLANDSFEYFLDVSKGSWAAADFPWAPFFVSIGFLTTLFIEEAVLHILSHGGPGHDYADQMLRTDEEFGHPLIQDHTSSNKSFNRPSITSVSHAMRKAVSGVGQGHDHDHGAGDILDRGVAVAFVFLCAISCHSFISGLGVGAMNGSDIWSGIIAVVAHKGLASFTLANCFVKAKASKFALISSMSFFSLVTPLGIMVGSLLSTGSSATEGVLIGLAGGSFIYIGIMEVISKELECEGDKIYKLFLILLGWGLMSMLAIWV